MAKIRYLVGKPGDQKFKRNIPARLHSVAGKTAFVERVHSKGAAEIRRQGNLFALRTDGELQKFKALASTAGRPSEAENELNLSLTNARQIALSYFLERHQANLLRGDYFALQDDPDFADLLSDAGEAASVALRVASGAEVTTDPKALELLVRHGIVSRSQADQLSPDRWPSSLGRHKTFQLLCRLIERADLELANRRYLSLNLGTLAPIRDDFFANAESAPSQPLPASDMAITKTIADLKELFLGTKTEVTRSRSSQYRIPFRVLEEQIGALPLGDIDRDRCRELMDFLPKVPSHAAQHYPNLTLEKAAELFRVKTGAYADRHAEAQKHVAILKSAFDLAKQEGWIAKNPWDGIKVAMPRIKKFIAKGNTYEPFSVSDLNKLFSLPLFVSCIDDENGCHTPGPNLPMRHRYWAPILALWTGMRMNEILQLEKADIRRSIDNIPFIQVTDQEHGDYSGTGFEKRLKTGNAVRNIPLHHQLIAMGFLRWVDGSAHDRLFPEALARKGEKPSDVYSKRFASNAKFAGVWKSRRRVFHSFRNNFNDALRNASVDRELRDAINGWSAQASMDSRYGQGQTIKRLHDAVERVQYEGLDLDHLVANAARIGGTGS
ncbi:site-specific integrase [Mesorhizobium sp. M0563]|uniref:site-specific integrase n=1 Tax=Mesorhizobium sp. M0563 TaxID=2956959 RepID=UPI00333D6013